jgi:hypothetical protein
MGLQTMDTYITLFGVLGRRVYKIYFSNQDLPKLHALYEVLLSLFHDVVLQYTWIITLHLCHYLQSYEPVSLVQWGLHDHIRSFLQD